MPELGIDPAVAIALKLVGNRPDFFNDDGVSGPGAGIGIEAGPRDLFASPPDREPLSSAVPDVRSFLDKRPER